MLKSLALAALVVAPTLSLAQERIPLMECSVTLALPGEPAQDMTFRAVTVDGTLKAFVDQKGKVSVYNIPSTLTMGFEQVRAGLNQSSLSLELNFAEKLIAHAMMLEAEPTLSTFMSSGIELEKVRSARTFTFGEATNMGSTTVVEALDENGTLLGSFLGGFIVTPCK